MNEEELTVSNEFIIDVDVRLSHEQYQQLYRFLNLHYLGDVHCNELDESGFYFPKYPDKETDEFKEASRMAGITQSHRVKVIFDVNGNSRLELV